MITKKFRDMPLKIKIELIILGCIFFTSSIAFFSIHCISNAHKRVLYQSVSSNLAYSASEVCSHLQEAEELANMILSNSAIQTQLPVIADSDSVREKQNSKDSVYNTLTNYLFNTATQNISYISILQGNSTISTHALRFEKVPADLQKDLIKQGARAQGATIWVTDYSQDYGLFLVKELRETSPFSLAPIGTLIINLNPNALIEETSVFHSPYEAPSFLMFDNGKNIYASKPFTSLSQDQLFSGFNDGYCITKINDKSFFAVKGQIPSYEWDYIAMISYSSIAHTFTITSAICICVMLLSLWAVFFFSSKILSTLTRHFDRLIGKMNLVGNGIYKFTEPSEDYSQRKDEIGQLHFHFNSMAQKLDTLITENYTNELLKKEAQLKALESQMDPHFLYNTLDSINWRAKAVDADDIVQITTALGNLLRISLSKTNLPFTLAEEMKLLDNYIIIQKLRYPQRLKYTVDIPSQYKNLLIPKFTIQPILENAIRYGLEGMSEVCHISIRAVVKDKILFIEVQNNGSSFEEHLLEKLEAGEILPHGFGIGLLNIHKRLTLAYGKTYGLSLKNMEDRQTGEMSAIVQISLPAIYSQTEEATINTKERGYDYVKITSCR